MKSRRVMLLITHKEHPKTSGERAVHLGALDPLGRRCRDGAVTHGPPRSPSKIMFNKPAFPPDQPWYVWTVVILCFVFWLLAYALIIRWSFKEKTFGMPIAALIGNIAWEGLFSHYFVPSFWLIQLGNTAWVGLDVLIFIAAWKYGPADFAEPFIKRWLRTIMVVGVLMTLWIEIPFTR